MVVRQYQAKVTVGRQWKQLGVTADGPRDAIGEAAKCVPDHFVLGEDDRVVIEVEDHVMTLFSDELSRAASDASAAGPDRIIVDEPGIPSGLARPERFTFTPEEIQDWANRRKAEPCPSTTSGVHERLGKDDYVGSRCVGCGKVGVKLRNDAPLQGSYTIGTKSPPTRARDVEDAMVMSPAEAKRLAHQFNVGIQSQAVQRVMKEAKRKMWTELTGPECPWEVICPLCGSATIGNYNGFVPGNGVVRGDCDSCKRPYSRMVHAIR